jgi:hypothetical protein
MNIAAIPPTSGPVAVEPVSAGSAAGGSSQAGVAATAHITAAPVTDSSQPVTPEAAQAQVVRAATEAAVTRQGSLAPLLADVAQAVQAPGLPATVRTALQQVLALATPTDPPPTAADLKQAVAASGLFLESQLAAGTTPPTPDLKAALLVAQQVLKSWLVDQPAPPAQAGGPATATPPPYHDGPTTAQPPALASLPAGADPASIGHRLLTETGAALARQQLLQIASLPGGHAGAHTLPASDSARWQFEIPLQTPQGVTIAQFKVSRDGGGGAAAAAAAEPVWRAGFSIDLEPMGPIHAQVALSGARAGVTLWAERPASAEKLRAQAAALTQGLQSADFLPEVAVYAGAPPRLAAPAGQFVDQAS